MIRARRASTGKPMNLIKLQQVFTPDAWPQFLSLDMGDHDCVLLLKMNPEIRWFTGHFPGQPVLAGVVQTHWAAELSKAIFPLGETFQRIDNLKFQTVILPKQIVSLHLRHSPDSRSVKFTYQCADTLCSEGKLTFN